MSTIKKNPFGPETRRIEDVRDPRLLRFYPDEEFLVSQRKTA